MTSSEFSEIFAKYWSRFILISASYVHDRKAAEDIVSEVFAKLWDERETIELKGTPEAYILKMVKNRTLNYLRDTLSHEKAHQNIQEEKIRAIRSDINSLIDTSSDRLVSNEMRSVLQTFMSNIPPLRRKIFYYAKFEGLTYAEIAIRLGITPRKVKREISLVLNSLRELFSDYMV